jgi:hypothetical protein
VNDHGISSINWWTIMENAWQSLLCLRFSFGAVAIFPTRPIIRWGRHGVVRDSKSSLITSIL